MHMKRDDRLVKLSWDHHHGLVMSLRLARELPEAGEADINALYSDLIRVWAAGLLPHFRAENECLLARLIRHTDHSDEIIARTQRDHLDLDGLVATMKDTDNLESRRTALAEFGTRLRDHIRWEEQVLFERSQELLRDEELTAIGEEVAERLPNVVPP